MEFELGQTYSGYKFLDVVGRSRSAVQYRVQNTLAQRVEGLRTLTSAAGDDPDAVERFLREVRIRARLSHPHIVTFYTAVPIEGRMAMTTELPDSLSLAERLHLGPLPWEEALDITRQLLEALGCIHQQSFVHRDVTPENILFGPGGFCKLAEFSLARPLEPAHATESGAVVGNPRYISPEQVKGERSLDQRSDLYSLGVVLYEMLCGRPPFESRSQFELMMAHVNLAPTPPSSIRANLPKFLDAVVLKALAKDAADRYQSAADFASALDGANAGGESVERATELTEPATAVAAGVPELVAVAVPETAAEAVAVMLEEAEPEAAIEPAVAECVAPEPEMVSARDVVPEAVAVMVEDVPLEPAELAAVEPLIAEAVPEAVAAEDVEPERVIAAAEPAISEVVTEAIAAMVADVEPEPVMVLELAAAEAAIAEVVPEVVVEAEPVTEPELAAGECAIAEAVPEAVAVVVAEDVKAELVTEPELAAAECAIAEVVPDAVAVMVAETEAEPVTECAIAEAVPEVVAVIVAEAEAEPVTEPAISEVVPQVVAVMVAEAEAEPVTEPVAAEAVPEVVAAMAAEAEVEPVTEPVAAEAVPEAVAAMAAEAEVEPVTEPVTAEAVPEAVAAMAEEAEAEPVAESAIAELVPEAAAVTVAEAEAEPVTAGEMGVTEPSIAECAAPELETVPVMAEVAAPASEQIAEAVEEPAAVIVPELVVSTEPAIAEAAVLRSCEETRWQGKAPAPQGSEAAIPAIASQVVSAETAAAVPAPAAGGVDVASEVAALASAWITEVAAEPARVEAVVAPSASMLSEGASPEPAAAATAPAVTVAASVAAPSPAVVELASREPASWAEVGPSPIVPAGVPAEDAAVSATAPPDPLHKNLWAAAEMVAQAVSPHAAPPVSVAPAPLPLVAAAPPAPAPAAAPIPQAVPEAMPPFMTRLRRAPDHLQWAVFGGAAAFLGVIWVAIWLAVGK